MIYRRDDSPCWWMYLKAPGRRPRRRSTGIPHDAPSKEQRAELKRQAETIFARAQAGLALEAAGVTAPSTKTVAQWLDWYERHVVAHQKGAVRSRSICKRLRADLGPIPLGELARERILEWRTTRATAVSPATVNRELDVLKAALSAAVPTEIPASPARGVLRLKHRPAVAQILSRADEAKLLAVLGKADRAVLICAIDTLMRAGDLLRLTWADDHGTHLSVRDPKTDRAYQVPVSSRLRTALDGLSKRGTYIFGHRRSGNGRSIELWRMLRDACLRAGVATGLGVGVTFHALRHTGASRLVEGGVDLRTVQQLGGWANLKQLARYAHPTADHLRAAVEVIGRGVSLTPDSRDPETVAELAEI
jgi:integrase